MTPQDPQQSFEEAARLLIELQDQLTEYRSLVDTLHTVSEGSGRVGAAAEKIAAIVEALGPVSESLQKNREALKRSLELTFQTPNHSQEKARELQERFEKTGAQFKEDVDRLSSDLRSSLQKRVDQRADEIGENLKAVFSEPENLLSSGLGQLRILGIANLGLLGLVLLAVLWWGGRGPADSAVNNGPVNQSSLVENTRPEAIPTSPAAAYPEPVRIQVLNGCGVPGIAADFKKYLDDNGLEVGDTDNAGNFGYLQTRINTRPGSRMIAERVAEVLRLHPAQVHERNPEGAGVDIEIILGKDYRNLRPYR
ncbi:MAG TPA: LytR C-terminal domain-containing protein, partial [Calditrichia bacterium]|nr:LytR C-terminal domain-containing protein [Calditrichia bacterium]